MMIIIFDYFIFIYFCLYITLFIIPLAKISNISGPTIGMTVLLSLRYTINKNNFSESLLVRKLKKIISLDERKLLFFATSILFFASLILSIARHFSLSSGASDLGIFDQAIWNTAQGNVLFSSLKNISLLGDHFEPILLLIAPLYKLWPNVLILFIVQSALLSSVIIPLYLIAKDKLKERVLVFVFIISYILSKPLRGVALSDFHPECFILPLLFWLYYFLEKNNNILLFLFSALLLACKEDMALILSTIGLYCIFAKKRAGLGLAFFVFGISAWIIETKVIIPSFNPSGAYSYMNRLPFGPTYMENIKVVLTNPNLVFQHIFQKEKINYVIKLFGPVGFLPLVSLSHYILIAFPLSRNLLPASTFSGWYDISSHYTASIIPFIYISAISGTAWFVTKSHSKNLSLIISCVLVFLSLIFYGKTDGYKLSRFFTTIRDGRTIKRISYLKQIPNGASVATNFNLVPHLSHRKYIYEWNPNSFTAYIAEYVIIDMSLLDYLSKNDMLKVPYYLNNIGRYGYHLIFQSQDKKFLIFRNPKCSSN